MELSVFAKLAKAGAIKQVILGNDPLNSQLTIVNLETVFGDTLPLTTASKQPRRFRNSEQALKTLFTRTGELKHVKIKKI